MRPPTALTIAGSDSGGGAGIQADLKTFIDHGVYGMSVITAITAQNTRGVNGVWGVDPVGVRAQLEAVFADLPVDVVKIGMLGDRATIAVVASFLEGLPDRPLICSTPSCTPRAARRCSRPTPCRAWSSGWCPWLRS